MSLLPFLLVTGVGALAALSLRGRDRLATGVGLLALFAAFVAALLIQPSQSIAVGDGGIATTDYLRLFLVLGALVCLLLAIVGAATGVERDGTAVSLGILATSALALSIPDPRVAVLAATAGGAFGALVALAPVGGRTGATVGTRVLRATAIAGMMAIAATAWIGRDLSELAAQPIVFGLAYLAFALAVAIRFGAIPLHTWAARLTDSVPETSLPLVTAIAPAALAIVALAWADASIAPLALDLSSVRAVVLLVAIASILLASLAAWIQDDIEHIVGYAIVGDAGIIILAIAALDPEAWAPARTWILAFVVARSAFAAWAAATRATFATGRVAELRGWVLRAPVLAVVFGVVVLASIGLPPLAAAQARGTLVDLVFDGPLAFVVLLGTLSPLAYYGRLFAIGLGGRGGARMPWRPVVTGIDLTHPRSWFARTWNDNQLLAATGGAALLAVLALVVSAGAFGAPQAAAGLPPMIGTSVESFAPGESEPPPEATPSGTPEASPSVGASPAASASPSASPPTSSPS
jgi:formate hydrogenlyase subunit 3/multisubunit Na+/H+ antiporter MnhD subunit